MNAFGQFNACDSISVISVLFLFPVYGIRVNLGTLSSTTLLTKEIVTKFEVDTATHYRLTTHLLVNELCDLVILIFILLSFVMY